MPAVLFLNSLCPSACFSQTKSLPVGVGVNVSSLGIGIQGAVGVTRLSNIRAGFNAFNYNRTLNKDGIDYAGSLKLRSVQATWDQFFPHLGGFHISPGFLLYNGNGVNATAKVPGGQSFSLGDNSFYSSATNPVSGSASVNLNKAAPMVLLGFGNLLPRGERHFGISFEIGAVFQGSPKVNLNLGGTTCSSEARLCVDSATDHTFQSSVASEQQKLNDDLKLFKYYPVISVGFSYKF
jgi:hypothetical protein